MKYIFGILLGALLLSCGSNQNKNAQKENIVFSSNFNYKNCFDADSLKQFYVISNQSIDKADFLLHFAKIEMMDSFGIQKIYNDTNKNDLIRFVYNFISGDGTDYRFKDYNQIHLDSTLNSISNAIINNHYPTIYINTYQGTGTIDTQKITARDKVYGYLEGNIDKSGKIYLLYFDFGNGGSMTFLHFIIQDGTGFQIIVNPKDFTELKNKFNSLYSIKDIYGPDNIKYISSNRYQLTYRGYLESDPHCCPSFSITLSGLLLNNQLNLLDDTKIVKNSK